MSAGGEPKRYFSDQKWDEALDVTLRRLVYGTLAGSVAALLLARAPTARATCVGLGAGFGLGSAWQQNQEVFHEILGVPSSSK